MAKQHYKFTPTKPMRLQDVRDHIKEAQAALKDPEAAHSLVDDFLEQFVRCIALGMIIDPEKCAEVLLEGIRGVKKDASWWRTA